MAKALPLPVVQSGLESSIDQVRKNIKPINVPVNVDPSAFKNLAQPLGRVSGLATEFEKSIAASNARVLAFGASVGIINGVQNAFASLLRTGIEVQKTLAEIAAISGQSGEALSKFGDSLFEVGKLTGQSFQTAAQAALEFSRQGLSTEETLKRTQDALTLTRFTTLNAAEAVDVLTAAANSFADTGITTAEILNKLVAVDTKFAVSAEDLANGLARAGSIAQEVGVSFDELNAAITIAQERTARGGSVIGNALKTIFTRLRSDETVQALRAIGVESLNAQGGLKGAIPLLEEVAQKLEGLSEGERVQILEAIASKYNINILSAILTDLSDANKKFGEVVGISAAAGNQAYERQVELNKALAAQINVTTVSVEQLFNKLAEIGVTESLSNLLKFVNGLLDGLNKILDSETTGGNIAKGLIKGISEIFFTVGLPLLGAIFIKLTKDIAQFGVESLKTILGINQQVRERQALEQAVVNTLIRDQEIMATILSLSGNRAKQEEYLLSVYNRQLAALQQVQSIAAGVAPALQAAGLSATSGTVKRRAAEGYLPAAEARDVRRGVGGASPSSKVVEIPNFSFGGGKRGTMVANTSEYIVPNYAGGSGTAIFNQDMAKEYGLPPGAKKITASGGFVPTSGFVPNFADSGLKGIGGLQGKELPYNVKKNLTPAEAKKVERYFEKTVVESAAKNPYEGQVDVAHILAGRIFESRAQGLEYIDLQENDPKPDIKSGPYSVAEAKLSYQAGLDDPRLAKGGEKGDKLLVPKTAKQDENINKKLSEKGVTAKKHGSIGHSFLFAKAKELIQRYRNTPREEIIKGIGGFGPNKIPIFDSGVRSVSENASTGYIPNFINSGFVWTGAGERLENYGAEDVVPAGNATRGKKWERVKANYRPATQEELNTFAAKAAKQMNENISVTAQHPAGAVMLVPKQEQARAVNKESQAFGFKPKDGLKTPEGEGINFVKFAAFGVNDEKFKSKSGAKMSDIQMRIKDAIGSVGADIANDFKVLTKEPLDKDGFYKLFDKKQGAGGSVSAVAGSIFEAATDYTLNPAGNPDFSDPDTSFDVGSLTPNLIDVFDIKGDYGPGTKADFKISEARARAFADQVVLNRVYKKIDKTTGVAKAAKGYIPNFASQNAIDAMRRIVSDPAAPQGEKDAAASKLTQLTATNKSAKTNIDLTRINPEYFEQQKKNYAYYMGLGFTKDASLNVLQGVDRARGTSTIDQLPKLKTFKQKNPLLFTQLETFVKQPNGRTAIEKILKENSALSFQEPEKSAARGFVPSFAANEPLKEAISREVAAGVSPARVRVTQDDRLQNSKNPEGLAVINTRDEPNGKIPSNFRKRAARQEVASAGFVPNFAQERIDAPKVFGGVYKETAYKDAAKELNKFLQEVKAGTKSVQDLVVKSKEVADKLKLTTPVLDKYNNEIKTLGDAIIARRNAEVKLTASVSNATPAAGAPPAGGPPAGGPPAGGPPAATPAGAAPSGDGKSAKGLADSTEKAKVGLDKMFYALSGITTLSYTLQSVFKDTESGLAKLAVGLTSAAQTASQFGLAGGVIRDLTEGLSGKGGALGALGKVGQYAGPAGLVLGAGVGIYQALQESNQQERAKQAKAAENAADEDLRLLKLRSNSEEEYKKDLQERISLADKTIEEIEADRIQSLNTLREKTNRRLKEEIDKAPIPATDSFGKSIPQEVREEMRSKVEEDARNRVFAELAPERLKYEQSGQSRRAQIAETQEVRNKAEKELQRILSEEPEKRAAIARAEQRVLSEVKAKIPIEKAYADLIFNSTQARNKAYLDEKSSNAGRILAASLLSDEEQRSVAVQIKRSDILRQQKDLETESFNATVNEIRNKNSLAVVDESALKILQYKFNKGQEILDNDQELLNLGFKNAASLKLILASKAQEKRLKAESLGLSLNELNINEKLEKSIRLQNTSLAIRAKSIQDATKREEDLADIRERGSRELEDIRAKAPLANIERKISMQPFATREDEYSLALINAQLEKRNQEVQINNTLLDKNKNAFRSLRGVFESEIKGLTSLGEGTTKPILEKVLGTTQAKTPTENVANFTNLLNDLINKRDELTKKGQDLLITGVSEEDDTYNQYKEIENQIKQTETAIENLKARLKEYNITIEDANALAEEQKKQFREILNYANQLAKLRRDSPFAAGILKATNELRKESEFFKEKLGEEMTLGFRDGLRDALGAAISQTDDLNEALQNVATNFLKRMQDLFLQDAANNLTLGIKSGLSKAFSNDSGATAQSGLSSIFKSIGNFFTSGPNTPRAAVFAKGGYVKGYATGGLVTGGSGYKDDVPAMLSEGEYVIRKSSVNKYGASNLSKLNSGEAPKFAAGGIFLPGVRGGTAISGYKNLTAFANQTTTSGATDVLMGGRSTAFANLEDQSMRLSRFALLNEDDVINQEIRSAQEQALNIMAEREAYRTAQRKAFQSQLKQTAIAAALNFGASKLSSMFATPAGSKVAFGSEGVRGASPLKDANITGGYNLGPTAFGKSSDLIKQMSASRSIPMTITPSPFARPRGKSYGGMIQRYNSGGGATDDIPALLMGGEYVMNRQATKKYGKQFFDSINQGRAPRFADGGQVSTAEPSFAEKAASASESKAAGATNVSININVTGQTTETQTEGNTKQSGTDYKKMGEQIKQIVIQTINEEKRLGGSLRPRG